MCKGKGGHPAWKSLIHKCLLHVFEKMSLTEIINTDNHPPDLCAALLCRVKGNRIRLMVRVLTACSVQAPRIVRCSFLQHPTPLSMTTEIALGALNIYLSPVLSPNCFSFYSYLAFSCLALQHVRAKRTSQVGGTKEGFSCASARSRSIQHTVALCSLFLWL